MLLLFLEIKMLSGNFMIRFSMGRSPYVVMLCITLASCSITGIDRLQHVADEASSQRRAWNTQALKSYTYHVRKLCFCPDVRAVTVVVANGIVVSGLYDDTGAAVPASELSKLYTVDALYDVIQGALDRKAATLTVTYDSALHYPTSIQIDYIA